MLFYDKNGMVKFTKDEIEEFVKESTSIADVCRKCGWKPIGANYRIVKSYFEKYKIDTSHFTGKRSNIGNKNNKNREKNIDEYLTTNSNISSQILKYKLIKYKYKKYQCELCNISKWRGEQISLQLHHINGIHTDNRLENLQLLCPNCHSQTDTYCGYKDNGLKKRLYCKGCGCEIKKTKTGYCDKCYDKLIDGEIEIKLTNKVEIVYGNCLNCGKELHSKTKYGMCSSCANKQFNTKVQNKPSKEELEKLINEKSYEFIGRMYGVSGNTIKKYCKNLNIERKNTK